jgi:hypothetical protein
MPFAFARQPILQRGLAPQLLAFRDGRARIDEGARRTSSRVVRSAMTSLTRINISGYCPYSAATSAYIAPITGNGSARRRRWLRDQSRSRLHERGSAAMANNNQIQRVHDMTSAIVEQNARARELLVKALQVLQTPLPDTFIGRKTQEPFPEEPKPPDIGRLS